MRIENLSTRDHDACLYDSSMKGTLFTCSTTYTTFSISDSTSLWCVRRMRTSSESAEKRLVANDTGSCVPISSTACNRTQCYSAAHRIKKKTESNLLNECEQ